MPMRILITGADGQLGRELQRSLAGHVVRPFGHRDLDITKQTIIAETINAIKPNAVIHTAALTDTVECERDPEKAHAVNAVGAENVAIAAARIGAAMVYVSTNEVFDGKKTTAYLETDAPAPVSHYGRSKLEGERLVRIALREHYIVRSAWLYGHGGNNFVSKMLTAAHKEHVMGVTDEVSTPTWTRDLATAIAALVLTSRYDVYHLANLGEASRYDWLCEILRLAGKTDVDVKPVKSAEFRASLPPDAVVPEKPRYSVLANINGHGLGVRLRPWREALATYFAELE